MLEYWQVTFNTDGGTPAIAPIDVVKGTGMGSQYPANPTKSGFVFGGWYLTSDTTFAGPKYTSSTVINTDTDLIAKWVVPLVTNPFTLDLTQRAGTNGLTTQSATFGTAPAGTMNGSAVDLNFNSTATVSNNGQAACFKLTQDQIDLIMASSSGITVTVNGLSTTTAAQFRVSLADITATQNWNGTAASTAATWTASAANQINNVTLAFNTNKSAATCGWFIIQKQNNTASNPVTINSITIRVN